MYIMMKCFGNCQKSGVILVFLLIISIVTACVGFYILRWNPSAESTLRYVSIIMRHGERSPEGTYPLDPYKGDSFWPEGLGALSQRAKVELHRLGGFFRQRYDRFLSDKYSQNEIFVLSSYYDRCLMSASLVLAGLYPPIGVQLWNPDLEWQPIPVHTAPSHCDDKIWVARPCALLSKERAEWNSLMQRKLDENREFLFYLSNNTGLEIKTLLDVYFLFDNLLIVKEQGLPLPQWILGTNWDKLYSLGIMQPMKPFSSATMIKLSTGVLVNQILSNMKRKANSTDDFELRVNLYSAHDANIVQLWRGMKIIPEIINRPQYGAALTIELHEIDGKYQVKILYKESYFHENLIILNIEGCKLDRDNTCDLDNFVFALKPAAIDNFQKECEIHEESSGDPLFQ